MKRGALICAGLAWVVACSGSNSDDLNSELTGRRDGGVGGGESMEDGAITDDPDAGADGGAQPDAAEALSLSFEPSNVSVSALATRDVGDCVIDEPECEIDTDRGTIDCLGAPAPFRYATLDQKSGGLRAGVFLCRNVRVEAAASLRVKGTLPLVLVALQEAEIVGELSASATVSSAVGGGFATEPMYRKGGGVGGGAAARNTGIGGGGGGFCGSGGNGGASADPSLGGVRYGSPSLIPLLGGSGGGSNFYGGGAGGGAIQLVAGQRLEVQVTGVIAAGGGGGRGNEGQGGGGGSGGAILLESPLVTVAGTLAVNGGAGGQGSGANGGPDASSDATPAPGAGLAGGNGSAGTVLAGSDARLAPGGGGGGAGRIRINSGSGVAAISGVLSPGLGSECVSQAPLGPLE